MMLVVAALLSPREYGLIGLSVVVVVTAQVINEFGIWQAVVHRSNPDERFLNTAFTANVLGGFATTAVFFFVAPWVTLAYGEPEMTALLRVMGLTFLPDAIFYVPDGMLRKQLRFRSRVLPEIVATFGAGVVTVAALLLGVGVLSYGLGFVAESVLRCVLTLWKVDWRPKLEVYASDLKEIAMYARHILGADLARWVSSNLDYLIVGFVLGAGPLGFYTLAFNLANYPVANFAQILSRLTFPTFAHLKEDKEHARRAYLKVVQLVAALVLPVLAMLVLLAAPLVVGLLGEEWRPAIFVLQVMVVAGISRAVAFPGSDLLRALGFQSVPFKVNVLEGLAIAVALPLIAARGIEVVALTMTVIMSLASWTTTAATCRTFGIRFSDLGRAFVPGMALAASGAGAIYFLQLFGIGLLPDILEVATLAAAAAAAMLLCLVTALRGFLRGIVTLVASKRPGKP
jgi:O-antigen/teichoic acid export membrane protein